jgi:hypothetical protein
MSKYLWSKETPQESGWYWYRHSRDIYPGLPEELYEPKMLALSKDPADGSMRVDDIAEPFCEFDASKMKGEWQKVVPPNDCTRDERAQPANAL